MEIKKQSNAGFVSLSPEKRLLWMSIYAVAMGLLEAAVVVYLRELYYPGNASLFPMRAMPASIAFTEIYRELATVVMLVAVAYLSARNFWARFGFFLVAFAIWDLFYYVFLYVFMQWPASLMEWDILFLVPVPWFGPVITPCIIALLMCILGVVMILNEEKEIALRPIRKESMLLLGGTFVLLVSFMWHFIIWVFKKDVSVPYQELVMAYVPRDFAWEIYVPGILMLVSGIYLYHKRIRFTSKVFF